MLRNTNERTNPQEDGKKHNKTLSTIIILLVLAVIIGVIAI